jgi:hypothetical protein
LLQRFDEWYPGMPDYRGIIYTCYRQRVNGSGYNARGKLIELNQFWLTILLQRRPQKSANDALE